MRAHHEAMSAPTETPAWAVIYMGANGIPFVVASSKAVSHDVADISPHVNDLGLPTPPHSGFWLWEGTAWFDGLDGCGLDGDTLSILCFTGAAQRIARHESI